MRSLTLASPAKINLYLKVTGRRPDGFHTLVTLFHRISLKDTLRLTMRPSGFVLKTSHPELSTGEDNLVTRAYRLLQKEIPGLGGVSVYLKKRIPLGSGLGGGSSNAAFFLLGMKKLYRLRVPLRRLVEIGKKLGADVPFFLYDVNQAIGTGLGDKILIKPSRARHRFVLLLSNQGLSTKDVYQSLPRRLPAVSLTKINRTVRILAGFLDSMNFAAVAKLLLNDLEPAAFSLRPSIGKTMKLIEEIGVSTVRMSGSGPTLFVLLAQDRKVKSLIHQLQQFVSRDIAVCHTY